MKKRMIKWLCYLIVMNLGASLGYVGVNTGLATKAAYETISKAKLKKYSRSTQPLMNIQGQRYCSSSHIRYKKKVFTVTNVHCCEAIDEFGEFKVRIGNVIETILHKSPIHDVCVLTASKVDKALILAKKDVEMWDSILVMGYPRGFSLTPSAGTIITTNKVIQVGDIFSSTFYPSHEALVKILPGNSGSPVLNKNGKVVGLAYATYGGDMTRGILVPLRYVENALKQAYNAK